MRSTIAMAGLLAATAGCYQGRTGAAGETDPGGGESGETGDGSSGGDEDPPPMGCNGEAFDPGPTPLRRLTHAEYAAAVRDVLGVDAGELTADFPDDVVTGSFDNDATNQTISVLLGEAYLGAAQDIAAEIVASPAKRDAVVGCDPAEGDGCLQPFVTTVGRRLWRRPLTEGEVDGLLALARDNADTDDEKVSIILEAALQSPHFLFRVERGVVDPDAPGVLRLGGYEIATRLSFFLWGTTPDDTLLDAAEAGELDTAAGVQGHARRMLADDRARQAMAAFARQWFRVTEIEQQYRDPEVFPEWDAALAASMRTELDLLVDDFMWGDVDFLGLHTADHGWVDGNLAALYGVTGGGSDPTAVDWSNDADRGGFFTTAAFATASSRAGDTSPVTRAVYVREVVLCDPPPAPPADVPLLEPEDGESAQDAFERHTADPLCASCHLSLDPIGHGLERYDSLGRLRATYEDGTAVRKKGTVQIDGEMHEFAGGKELGVLVADSPAAERCVVAHAQRFAMGRLEAEADTCALDRTTAAFADNGRSFEAMLVEIVTSDSFRYRRAED